jgi:hypothetical protein
VSEMKKYRTPHQMREIRAAERRGQPDPFARNVERHDQMRSLAPQGAEHPARHMSPRAGQIFAFDEAIIRSHPRKEST